jgi:hypothetical protein
MLDWKIGVSDTSPLEALSQDTTHELRQVRRRHVRRLLDNHGGGGGNDTDANETITGTDSRKAVLARLAIVSIDPYL